MHLYFSCLFEEKKLNLVLQNLLFNPKYPTKKKKPKKSKAKLKNSKPAKK